MENNISPQLKSKREWLDKIRNHFEAKGVFKKKYNPKPPTKQIIKAHQDLLKEHEEKKKKLLKSIPF